jgi:hypothetical protein
MIISALDTIIAKNTSYTISYTPVNPHPIGTTITIEIPEEITVGNSNCSTTTLNTNLNCLKSGNTIEVQDAFTNIIQSP